MPISWDPLVIYMSQLADLPRFDPEQIRSIYTRGINIPSALLLESEIYQSLPEQQQILLRGVIERSHTNRDLIVISFLPLVIHISRREFSKRARFFGYHNVDLIDLIQIGSIELIKAVEDFDLSYNTLLYALASKYIYTGIYDYIKSILRDKSISGINLPHNHIRGTGRFETSLLEEDIITHVDNFLFHSLLKELLDPMQQYIIFSLMKGRSLTAIAETLHLDRKEVVKYKVQAYKILKATPQIRSLFDSITGSNLGNSIQGTLGEATFNDITIFHEGTPNSVTKKITVFLEEIDRTLLKPKRDENGKEYSGLYCLLRGDRDRVTSMGRKVTIYILEQAGLSIVMIARLLKKDHGSINQHLREFENLLKKEEIANTPIYTNIINQLTSSILERLYFPEYSKTST